MPGLLEEVKKRVNRPVPALLPISDDTDTLLKNGGGKGATGDPGPRPAQVVWVAKSGGDFTTLGGQPRTNIARLNADGTLDTSAL